MSPWPAPTESHLAGPAVPASPIPTPAKHVRRAPRRWRPVPGSRPSLDIRQPTTPNLALRQDIADQAEVEEAITQCRLYSGNDQYSCFPTSDTVLLQGQWASFVWNSKRPELVQDNKVNVYLYRADSIEQIYSAEDLDNDPLQPGVHRVLAGDSWWGENGAKFNEGQNTTYPFYWVITPASRAPDGSQHAQSIFSAIQTNYPTSVLSSMSISAAAAAASSSSASESAASVSASASSAITTSTNGANNNNSDVGASSSDEFPRWAIAVIVVLGFLAIAALCILTFIILRRSRQKRYDSNRNSMASSSPMMAHADTAASVGSPLLPSVALSHAQDSAEERNRTASVHDGASTISRANSTGEGPFSGADAAIMADAFRKALRKPEFVDQPVEEGDSPSAEGKDNDEQLINRELAEEGRDIRSVASSRGVKVERSSDGD